MPLPNQIIHATKFNYIAVKYLRLNYHSVVSQENKTILGTSQKMIQYRVLSIYKTIQCIVGVRESLYQLWSIWTLKVTPVVITRQEVHWGKPWVMQNFYLLKPKHVPFTSLPFSLVESMLTKDHQAFSPVVIAQRAGIELNTNKKSGTAALVCWLLKAMVQRRCGSIWLIHQNAS